MSMRSIVGHEGDAEDEDGNIVRCSDPFDSFMEERLLVKTEDELWRGGRIFHCHPNHSWENDPFGFDTFQSYGWSIADALHLPMMWYDTRERATYKRARRLMKEVPACEGVSDLAKLVAEYSEVFPTNWFD